jgi:hypothetical protein
MKAAATTIDRVGIAQDRLEALWPAKRVRALLAVYGIAFAVFASFHLAGRLPNQEQLMGTRTDGVSASIAVLDQGGPPLLGAKTRYGAPGADPRTDYYPVGVTDDQGLYLYLPVLGVLTGEHDPHVLLKWFYIGCFALLFAVYPLVFYELMGSRLAALAAPPLVLHWFGFLGNSDLYWIVAWCILLGLPLVFAAYVRTWGRVSVALLLAAAFLASFSTSIRIHAGLPIVIAAVAVALLRAPSWRIRVLVAGAIVIASLFFSVGVLSTTRLVRDEIVGQPFRKHFPGSHPTWHNAYIGLGYLPNKYGITWNDQVSVDAVKRVDPHAGYLTSRYEHILRHLYFKLLRRDPSFVLGTLWTKFGVCLDSALRRFGWLLPFLLAISGLVGLRRRRMRWFLLLSIPAFVLTILPPIITIPDTKYAEGWLSTVGLFKVLFTTWVLASLPDLVRWAGGRPRPSLAALGVTRRDLAVTIGIIASLTMLAVPAITHSRSELRQANDRAAAG